MADEDDRIDGASLRSLILGLIKKNTGVDFTLSEEGEDLLKQAASEEDGKRRAALIINALEIREDSQIEGLLKADAQAHIDELVGYMHYGEEDLYEEPLLVNPELNRITAENILSLENENGLPKSVTFTSLEVPLFSMAYVGVIENIYFGDSEKWIYHPEMYSNTRVFLEKSGLHLPDKFFQIHHFFIYIQGYIHNAQYIGLLLNSALYLARLSDIFTIVDRLQNKTGHSGIGWDIEYTSGSRAEVLFEYDDELDLNIPGMVNDDQLGYAKGALKLFDDDGGTTGGMFFNRNIRRYMGLYYLGMDGFELYRSLPDYLNTCFSSPEYHILLAAFRTYARDNNLCVDDGLKLGKVLDGKVPILDKEAFGWFDCYLEEEDPRAAWTDAIPW